MNQFRRYFQIIALAVVLGCVRIPDTFEARIQIDIRHIEEQAGNFLDYVEGETDTLQPEGGETAGQQEDPENNQSSLFRRAVDLFDPMPVAYAQDIKDTSPLVKQIADRMRQRYDELQALKKTGAVGENNRGFLELIKPDELEGGEAENEAQRLISAENEDRKALYQEIARLNRDQELKVATVERIYAKERLERAKSGEMIQLPPEGEWFDKIKNSQICKRLGDACKPGEWVEAP